jgi:hypothetical protein
MDPWVNDIDGKSEELGKKAVPMPLSTNTTWTGPGVNPGLCGERLVTYCLSHGTAITCTFIILFL